MNFLIIHTQGILPSHQAYAKTLAEQTGRELLQEEALPEDIAAYCDAHSVDMLFLSCTNHRRVLQRLLNACRDLRLPYVFLTDTMRKLQPLHLVTVPVTLLEEDVHKAETCQHLGRYTGAEIVLLQANDYGHRALQHTQRIATALEKAGIRFRVEKAKKDSFKVNAEAAERQKDLLSDLLLLTASRDYGLDDILFGPQERHVIQKSQVPVMLLNPRGDLYSLCD